MLILKLILLNLIVITLSISNSNKKKKNNSSRNNRNDYRKLNIIRSFSKIFNINIFINCNKNDRNEFD